MASLVGKDRMGWRTYRQTTLSVWVDIFGSAQQSVKKSNLHGFLESDVFALEAWPEGRFSPNWAESISSLWK
jgi:hypothetical protein